jgi:cytochrome b561
MQTQPSGNSNIARYDSMTIWLHWATVGLIVALWVIGQTGDWFPRGPIRKDVWSVHVLLGFAAGFVLVARLVWRAQFGRALPPADTGALQMIARVTHIGLYLLLAIAIALGLTDALYRGFSLFDMWPLPQIGTGDTEMRHSINEWHELAANSLVIAALFHGAAALVHHYVWRDHLLERMRPQRGSK